VDEIVEPDVDCWSLSTVVYALDYSSVTQHDGS
jgi:hypothetical protein